MMPLEMQWRILSLKMLCQNERKKILSIRTLLAVKTKQTVAITWPTEILLP